MMMMMNHIPDEKMKKNEMRFYVSLLTKWKWKINLHLGTWAKLSEKNMQAPLKITHAAIFDASTNPLQDQNLRTNLKHKLHDP